MFHHHLQQQQQQQLRRDQAESADQDSSMSNLTTSASAGANPPPPSSGSNKRKRSLPGNPDPESEVVALSPATLMATNRFLCEICGKGFQRDQNLQLHRRGHNLPWKLKQRGSKELVRKKVYICPEASCVHHDPSRALGDLTGIKKHFFRKHGEKKWKCDKCSKKYAVQSDWKAHSKICGTREYKCDCGTVFSRRDSFITHRAFCDALTEESAKAIGGLPVSMAQHHQHAMLFSPPPPQHHHIMHQDNLAAFQEHHHAMQQQQVQQQHCNYAVKPEMQPWPTAAMPPYDDGDVHHHHALLQQPPLCNVVANATPQSSAAPTPQAHQQQQQQMLPAPAAGAHLSATALLQKAAQMGATIGGSAHYGTQMAGAATSSAAANGNGNGAFGLGLSCLNNGNNQQQQQQMMGLAARTAGGRGSEVDGEGMTRDFLGLRAFSHRDILGLAGFDSTCMAAAVNNNNSSSSSAMAPACYEQPQQHGLGQSTQPQQQQSSDEPWHGMSSHS
ncbi:protein indeterminate-domain 7 [Brachypodium distachyon]|uniref:Protein EARLY HEADING DATE 2 n=1 Tax=Brachypodium distachyon TaxID=15368 RepID=A0A0Q3R4E5_BRADI|nr:protein indeterminate-domain 7 [Brachypodium distachyon]KQK08378.1 hypothetical protein BRADI_2g41550v3 [Brachypodium distachyon]|eukprot:XP_010231936.1 protein indeterminate-domain 7 [Brachypodium distachyon]